VRRPREEYHVPRPRTDSRGHAQHLDVDRVFTDKASGKDTERPQLKALLSYARDKEQTTDRVLGNLVVLRLYASRAPDRTLVQHRGA